MGDFLNYLFAWYNVWFTAPLALVFLFAIFRLFTKRLDFGGGDADVVVDVSVDAGGGLHRNGVIASVLEILNVGKVPLTCILMALFLIWGILGLIVNEFLNINTHPRFGLNRGPAAWISLATAFLCSILGSRYLAPGLLKLLPESKGAITGYDLIGLTGRVISGRVTTTFGTARVTVPDGPELTVSCRVRKGEDVPLKGATITLVAYDPNIRIYDATKAKSSMEVI